MKIRIDLKILIFFAIFYFSGQLGTYLWILLFCFLHEMGHLAMGLALGFRPEKIEVMPLGFCMKLKENTKKEERTRQQEILIALAGPMTNLIIIIMILLLHISFIGRDIAVYVNILIFAFNLLPIFPLDGGRIAKEILKRFYKEKETETMCNKISNYYMIFLTMVGSIAIYYFKNIAILFILTYLWLIVIEENKKISVRNKLLEMEKTKQKYIQFFLFVL